jgi:UDP-glucose 4-epimerase
MTTMLIGGTGFVGLNAAEALLARGQTVLLHALDAPPEPARAAFASLPGRLIAVQGDARDTAALVALAHAHRVDRVVYAAAITAGPARERAAAARILETNAVAAVALYQAMAGQAPAGRLTRFVFLSSVAVYGEAGYGRPVTDESVEPVPDSLYAISKYTVERALRRLRDPARGDAVCLRLGPVYGPWERDTGLRDTLSPPYAVLGHARAGRPCVLPRPGLRDWVYARDVGEGIAAAVLHEGPLAPVYNLSAGAPFTLETLAGEIAKRHPGFAARVGSPATIDLYAPADRAPLSIAAIARDIGWRPRFSPATAVADWLDWFDRFPDFA